jgi:uncharacterized membrane protein
MLSNLLITHVKENGVAKIIMDYYVQMSIFEELEEELQHYYNTDNKLAYISLIREIPETILNENLDYINWHILLQYKKCSENFLDMHYDIIRKNDLSDFLFPFQSLSMEFINKHKKKYTHKEWYYISLCQNITQEFITENKKDIVFYALANNSKIY